MCIEGLRRGNLYLSKSVSIDMVDVTMGNDRQCKSAATALTLLVVMAVSMGLPFHLSHDHHHQHPPVLSEHATVDHQHERHDIADHDWDGLRARLHHDECLPAVHSYNFQNDHLQTFATTPEAAAIPRGTCLGPPQYRAPPFA